MLKKFKDFLIEYELIAIPVFLLICIFSYQIIQILFFAVEAKFKVHPGVESFYYALFSILIWFGFWLVSWGWERFNWNEYTSFLKHFGTQTFNDLAPEKKLYVALGVTAFIFLSLLGVAAIVFP